MSADTNPFVALQRQLAGPSLQVGDVVAGAGSTWTVSLLGGGQVTCRGSAAVGQRVFFRGGLIEGQAPGLPLVTVDIS